VGSDERVAQGQPSRIWWDAAGKVVALRAVADEDGSGIKWRLLWVEKSADSGEGRTGTAVVAKIGRGAG
jgi:hypothetical protein